MIKMASTYLIWNVSNILSSFDQKTKVDLMKSKIPGMIT